VPEPLVARDGTFLVQVGVPGAPEMLHCSLLRWIKGRSVLKRMQPHHYHTQGRLMALLHEFSAAWSPPPGSLKRNFDWEGLFVNDVGSDMPTAEAWSLLPPKHHEAFAAVAEQVRKVMDAWGKGREVYGLIHGDLALDANLLFWRGQPVAIDFDDSGFGYYVYDLAVALEHCWDHANYGQFRDALLDGYTAVRSLPDEQAQKLELFMAACEVYWNLWAVGGTHLYPELLPEYQARLERNANLVVVWVEAS
jgi:Ser/Thr protein kinase RdoA (MazF antagonist)